MGYLDNIDWKAFTYMVLNVTSSIFIVFTNKWAMGVCGFNFGVALTFIHFVVTFLGLHFCAKIGIFEVKRVPISRVLNISFAFCSFVVLTNLSLQYNTVGFYQIMKVLTSPCIVFLQFFMFSQRTSREIMFSLLVIILGVILATVTDVTANLLGTIFAGLGVFAASFYQIWAQTKQKDLDLNAMQLLYYQAPVSAVMLIVFIPIIDDWSKLTLFLSEKMDLVSITAITSSAICAFFVNLSTFLLIGKTSPITYNVVGHCKLTLIILGGFIMFGDIITFKSAIGLLITFVGIFWYTHIKLRPAPPQHVAYAQLSSSGKEMESRSNDAKINIDKNSS